MLNHCHPVGAGANSALVALLLMTCWLIWRPCRSAAACKVRRSFCVVSGSVLATQWPSGPACPCRPKHAGTLHGASAMQIFVAWQQPAVFLALMGLVVCITADDASSAGRLFGDTVDCHLGICCRGTGWPHVSYRWTDRDCRCSRLSVGLDRLNMAGRATQYR